MNINYSIFTLLIPLLIQISPCSGTAKLMLRFDSFENTGFLKENGDCCDGERRNGICTGQCDYSVRVCLSRNASGDPCEIETFEVGTVDVLTSSFNFPNTFVSGFANPVPISLNSWQGDIIVTVGIFDEDTLREERVDTYNLTYTRFAPVSNRPIDGGDFLPYSLVGRRLVSPTKLDVAVTVQCDRFFYGEECVVNCVDNDDCNGHYTCNSTTGAKICNDGWGGDNCSVSLSADHGCLADQTCSNNAECIRYGNEASEFYCCCAPGYTGTNCEIDIDECAENPCQNGGSCTQDVPNSYECQCPIRFKGRQCQIQRNCDDDPCLNGGICRSVVGSFFCLCNDDYTGEICETLITTTPEITTPSCLSNYYGPSCSVFCEARDDCSGHYVCDSENGNKICNPTWGGINCTTRNFVDATCPCLNGGQCFDNQCCCPEEFTGSLCERRLYCNLDRCLNGGQCYEANNGFRCECRQGFTGDNCETEIQVCPADFYGPSCSVYCRPQDDCFSGQWNCNPFTGERQCRFGWTGALCNEKDPGARHRVACPDSDCRNGGFCANATCCCPVGYTGSLCHIEILECGSNPCRNNARCEDLIGDYLCICRPGFTGKNCETFVGGTVTEEPDPCLNVNCLNGGTCASNSSSMALCLCREGFMGDLCEITARANAGSQNCPENFYGPGCLIYCQEEDSCERGHFYCDTVTGQRICRNGWIGTICNTRVLLQEYDPECPVVGCRNKGQCFNGSCCCTDSSQGEFCQEELLPCDAQPCQNGGTCQDLFNGYTCTCPPGYTGVDCATVVETTTVSSNNNSLEACDQERCQNGGVCIPTLLPFSCLCPNPFSGRYCEINISGTATTTYLQTIYLRGNVSDNNQAAIQSILQQAVDASATSPTCCLVVYIVEKTTYIDEAGDVVVGYVYNVTHSNGGTITPGQTDILNTQVNNGLQRTQPFRQNGVVVYTGPVQGLTSLQYAYTVDFIGDIPESRRQSVIADIEAAWRNAYPNCQCQFRANIVTSEEYAGEYGIRVSRVYYTITRDGQTQDPASTQAPSRTVFITTTLGDNSLNSVYAGSILLPYDQRQTVLLNSVVDINSDQGTMIREAIRTAWIQWKNTNPSVPESLRNAQVDIIMLRPQVYYTQDGRRVSRLEYFVVLDNTIIIGPPSTVTINSPFFCNGCDAVPVPFVDVRGSLTVDQIRTLGANLNPSDPAGVLIDSQQFTNSNGQPVTRVFYQPPISGTGVQSTAVSQQRLTQILTSLNLQQPSLPIERTYAVTFAGTVSPNDQESIRQILTNAWVDTYGIPRELISVDINSMDGIFTSSSGNGQLTQVKYTVSIQGADSQLTRFGGLDIGTLRRYFTSPNLVVVGGQGTLPTLETTPSVTGQTTMSPTTSNNSFIIDTIYIQGNISDNNQGAIEAILQNALNKSRAGSPCCLTLYLIERTRYTNPSGQTVTGYRYNISSTTGSVPSTLTPEQRRNFTSEINNELQTMGVFRQGGVVIYTGSLQDLQTTTLTYTVDFVGDVSESRRQAIIASIEEAWNNAYPDCRCQFEATIVQTGDFTGDYGIKVSRVEYTMRRDGQPQDPRTVAPPTRTIFFRTALADPNSNSVYSGSSLIPYNQHHSVLLNGAIDMGGAQGTIVRNAIQTAWNQYRQSAPALPPALRDVPLDIQLLKPETYYTPDGQELTRLEYFVVLNKTIIIGPQAANITLPSPMFCDGCIAVPVPSVDINGRLTPDQLLELGLNLDPTDQNGDRIKSDVFLTPSGGTVTRVYYQPPITDLAVQTTAVTQQRLDEILQGMNLQQPTAPTERVYTVNFAGSVNDNNRDTIEETISNAWAGTHGIPRDAITVKINNMDDNFRSSTNAPVTQVTYTVLVQGADSQWTRFGEVDLGILGGYFTPTGLVIVREDVTYNQTSQVPGGTTVTPVEITSVSGDLTISTQPSNTNFLIQTIFLKGNISDSNQAAVEDLLQAALNTSTGGACCRTLRILDKVTFLDPLGDVVVGYRYNLSNSTGGAISPLTPGETQSFNNDIQTRLQTTQPFRQFGTVMYLDPIGSLTSVQFTYTVDFIGDIPNSWRQAIVEDIEAAWQAANPGCECVFRGNYIYTDKFSGDHGITVSRVYYTMTRDGQTQNPDTVRPPAWSILANLVRGDNRVNSLYSGSVLLPYRLHHSVLLNGVVDMNDDEGRNIRNAIQFAWLNWRNSNPAVPPALRDVPLDIQLLKPETYYTSDGQELTRLEYFVVLNKTIIIGPQAANITLPSPMFCDGCIAVPVPSVDINGRLTPDQLLELGLNLDPTDLNGDRIKSDVFLTPSGGTVTRVYYQPPITDLAVQTTAVTQQRLDEILQGMNLQQPTAPTERVYTVNFAGSVNDNNRDTIEETISNAWAGTHGIPRDAITVKINNIDDNFRSSTNAPVTQVTYTVLVQGADSQWTRFGEVDLGILGGYFTPTGLVIVREDVTYNQTNQVPGGTTVTPVEITSVSGDLTISTQPSNTNFLIQTIFLKGNISDSNQAAVEDLLQAALNTSTGGACCRTLRILDKVTFLDPLGDVVVGYRYNLSNSTGGAISPLTPGETQSFNNDIQTRLQTTQPFRQFGTVMYLDPIGSLTSVQFTYTVDFIGDIPNSWRQAIVEDIEAAWQAANPGCECVFRGNYIYTDKFSGDHSITVSRVYYTMTRDGQTQNPDTVRPPAWSILANLVRGDNRVNSLYSGSVLLPYRLHHSVLLNGVVDMNDDEGRNIRNAIQFAWLNWRNSNPAVPPTLRTATLEIVPRRPQLYYTQDGRQRTYLEYFVVLNGTFMIGPQSANVPLTGDLFCENCNGIPVPFVEVRGQLTADQLQILGSRLNPADPSGRTVFSESYVSTTGEVVTRVYYLPPISGPGVESTAISPQRLNQILANLNLQEPSLPIQRTFTMNFAGSVANNNRDVIQQALLNAWAETFNVPVQAVTIDIISMNDNFISTQSNVQVTQVTYRVTIQGADSLWTRYEGLTDTIEENYFRPTRLIIMRGPVQSTQVTTPSPRTTPTPTDTPTGNPTDTPTGNPTDTSTGNPTDTPTGNPTDSPTETPTDAPTPTSPINTQTIYIRGNATSQNQTVVEEILNSALSKSRNGSSCCLTVHIVEWTSYVNPTGDPIVGYTYNVTNGSEPITLTPEEVRNLTREVNNEVLTIQYINYGFVIYTGNVTELRNVSFTYSVDYVGNIPESARQSVINDIENAWQNANPGCECVFMATIENIEEYSGDYGTEVSRVYYTITRDGRIQNPSTEQPPTQNVFQTSLQSDNSVNSVYVGTSPLPFNQRHNILLNTIVDMDSPQGIQVQNAIRTAWITWRNTDPSVSNDLRNAPVEILYLRPQTYYTQDGRSLTNVDYFVLLNNSIIIGPERGNISLTGPLFCNCIAIPVPFVDVNGDLTTDQLLRLGSSLNPSDPSGSTLTSKVFVNSNNEPVTRVYYRPPISGPDVQSTSVTPFRWTQILTNQNLEEPSLPIERKYTVNFEGSVDDNERTTIEQTIRNVWSDTYGIPPDVLSVSVNNIDDGFYGIPNNQQVTQVDYTVSVQGVDSHWTRFEGVDVETLRQYFTDPNLTLVLGQVTNIQTGETTTPAPTGNNFLIQTIYLRGNISETNQPAVEEILQNALNKSINPSCCLTLHIIEQTAYMDPSGNTVIGYQFNLTNTTGGPVTPMTPEETTVFNTEINNELQRREPFRQFGTVLYLDRPEDLIYVQYTYTVDFIGDIPDSQRRAVISDIEKAWQTANPDCQCLFKVSIVSTRDYTGEYGIKINRVYYTITRDGQIQDPSTTPAPSRNIFITTSQGDNSANSMYAGSLLLPFNQRHSVLLNGEVDMGSAEGEQIKSRILSVWTNWRNVHPAVPEALRNLPIEIRYLRTQPYYTSDGASLTRLEYFVVLNRTIVVGPQPISPSLPFAFFCDGCKSAMVPFVDIKGQLSPTQVEQLGSALNPSDPSGSTVKTQSFVDVDGLPVTRVYYRPPITSQGQPAAVSQERLTEILTSKNLEEPTYPIERTFAVNFAGSIDYNNRDNIGKTIRNVWSGTFGIPTNISSVNIVDMDDNYVSATGNDPVTKVTYTVTIQGADSYWTQFEGVDPGTLGRYFTSSDLVVVGGEVIYTQYLSSTPEPSTVSSSPAPPTPATGTGDKFAIQTVYFLGNVSDRNMETVEAILQSAMNRSMSGMACCVMVEIIEKTTYVNPSGGIVVGYRYNVTNSTGGTVSSLAPEQTNNFRRDLNNQLQRTDPFRQDGVVIYTGSIQGLRNIGITHYVDLIGPVPDYRTSSVVNAIDEAWRTAYPDCGCQFSSEILATVPLSGDYGIAITRVYYTMRRDGQVQSPVSVPSPSQDVLLNTVQADINVNSLYVGSSLYHYNQRHSVLLNRVVDVTGSQGNQVQQALRAVWNTWRNNDQNFPQSLRTARLEIILLRPENYYNQAGTTISKVEYFVIVDGTIIIGPSTASPSLTGPLFCGCEALPVPSVDVKGHLQWSKLLQLGTSLNPDDTDGSSLNREAYYDAYGEPVTRVFYMPPITDSNIQSTALSPDRLAEILTTEELEQPSVPMRKSFSFYFDGSLGDDHKETIQEGIKEAWGGTFAIPTEDIAVDVLDMDDNFYSTSGNGQVTQVTYTLSIQGADSRWTRYEGKNNDDLGQFFKTTSPDVTPCLCIAREGREIMVTGTVGNDTSDLETALIKAWQEANPDYTGTLSVGITQVEGATPTKLKYTVTPDGGPSAFTDSDLIPPSEDTLNNQLQPLDLTVYKAPKDDDSNTLAWAIPVGIILALLLLLIIIIIIFCVIRNRRNRMSHTLKQKPEEMNGYDKQHFSDEPHFENPAFDMDDPEVGDSKQRTYVVNEDPNMEEIKLK